AAVFFENLAGDRQAESGTVFLGRVEGIENLLSYLSPDARSIILDLDEELIALPPRLKPCMSSDPDGLGGVHEQIHHRLFDSSSVGPRPQRFVSKVHAELGPSPYEMWLRRVCRVAERHR